MAITSDVSTLKNVYNTLLERKQHICKELNTINMN